MRPLILALLISLPLALSSIGVAQDPVQVDLASFRIDPTTGRAVPSTTASPGDEVKYEMNVRNVSGETLPAGIVRITGPIAAGTTYVPGSATETPALRLEHIGDPPNPTAVRWTLLESLPPSESFTLTYHVRVNGANPRSSSSLQPSGSVNAFTQAMFGHLGIIEVSCTGEFKDDPTIICGESFDTFQLFQRQWDLYADWESQIPAVPSPQSAWRREDSGEYSRLYELNGRFFGVNFAAGEDGPASILIVLD